jgi:hypothetical protein
VLEQDTIFEIQTPTIKILDLQPSGVLASTNPILLAVFNQLINAEDISFYGMVLPYVLGSRVYQVQCK